MSQAPLLSCRKPCSVARYLSQASRCCCYPVGATSLELIGSLFYVALYLCFCARGADTSCASHICSHHGLSWVILTVFMSHTLWCCVHGSCPMLSSGVWPLYWTSLYLLCVLPGPVCECYTGVSLSLHCQGFSQLSLLSSWEPQYAGI